VGVVGLVDLAAVTALALLWFDIPMRGSAVVMLSAAILYILCGLSVGLLISTISRTQQEAFMSMFLFFQPAIILSGFFYPVENMPGIFQWVTLLNPVRHFLEIVRAVFLKGAGIEALWAQYLFLAVIAAAVLRLAVVRFPKTMRG
jgi:ABC-2 type transport system permease protein